jgi:hypothetical protein
VGNHRFGDLIPNAHDGIERGHWLLKNHGDRGPAQLAHSIVVQGRQVSRSGIPGEEDFAADMCLRRQKPHDGERRNRFARAGFTDQT